ncbi:MAG: hypothetical protein AAF368_01005, partial [Planctomycetota bacterium]
RFFQNRHRSAPVLKSIWKWPWRKQVITISKTGKAPNPPDLPRIRRLRSKSLFFGLELSEGSGEIDCPISETARHESRFRLRCSAVRRKVT